MGIKWLRELYVLVDGTVPPRPCQDCPPYVLKEELDKLYGKGKWCVVWDIAWDRQALDDSKTNKRTAVRGSRMVFDALNEEGCVTCDDVARSPDDASFRAGYRWSRASRAMSGAITAAGRSGTTGTAPPVGGAHKCSSITRKLSSTRWARRASWSRTKPVSIQHH